MKNQRITIQLQGAVTDEGHMRLTELIQQLEAIRDALKHTERLVTGTDERVLYYKVVDLSHNSPATVVLEAAPIRPQIKADIATRTVTNFFRNIRRISDKGKVSARVDVPTLESYRAMGSLLDKHVEQVKLTGSNVSVEISKLFQEKVTEIIGADEIVEGSLTGMLEWLNIHNSTNTFHLYPSTGPKKVSCHFPRSLKEMVISGIDRNVTVFGALRYKKRDNFPYAADVRDIEIHPDESELPTLASLRGMNTNHSGQKAADFIRSLRNGQY